MNALLIWSVLAFAIFAQPAPANASFVVANPELIYSASSGSAQVTSIEARDEAVFEAEDEALLRHNYAAFLLAQQQASKLPAAPPDVVARAEHNALIRAELRAGAPPSAPELDSGTLAALASAFTGLVMASHLYRSRKAVRN